MTKTCALYARMSLDRTGQAAGIERQEAECRDLAQRLGLEVVDVYIDNDISATTGKRRPAFEELLESGTKRVVTWHIDRLLRLSKDLERVLDANLTVHSVTSGHIDLSNPAGKATAKTIVAWSQYEGEQRTERQKAAHRQRKARGESWWAVRPFGYTNHGELVEHEAEAIRHVYREVAAGRANLAAHARWLNAQGLTTTGKAREWSSGTVRGFLLAERNLGGGSWQPLIDEATFMAARAVLHARDRGAGGISPVSMLTGIAVCGVCGEGMHTGTPPSHITSYRRVYTCAANRCASWPRDLVDEVVGKVMATVIERNRTTLETVAADGPDSTDALHRLALDFASERITLEEFAAATEREKARAARRTARPVPLESWAGLDPIRRRAACQLLIARIVLPSRGRGVRVTDPTVIEDGIVWR